jgi:endopeptidase La
MDSSKIKKWIDDVMKIPFGIYKGLDINALNNPTKIKDFLGNLNKLMDEAVYGHNHAKKHIVMMMAHMIRNPECMGNVFGIWGPPGNGKSSLVKEGIAKAMDRPFVFISLGGASDSSFLDGHSFTYEGSIYGRIAQALINSKCMNPIIYFDELDKVSTGHKGEEIINTLIHLLDPVQNKLYRDRYFYDIDLDLSKVTFIFSFNDPGKINYILRDRISMIETKFLSNEMKLFIGKNHLMVDICKDLNINKNDIVIPDDILLSIINDYTNEGGVRRLKEHLYKIARELNHINLTNNMIAGQHIKFPFILTKKIYNELFNNISKYIHLRVHKEDGIGMVNGLWANSLGQGGVLPIESALIPAKELMTVKTTGSLGDVIKESIEVALSVAWNKLDSDMKLFWMNKWKITPECFHIHCPDGSTGKEGPSAGAAMTLAFYSRLVNRKVKHTVVMTGEMNLREEVTEIGGLDEKLNAAKRAGATLALIPANNMTDLHNVIKNNPSLIDNTFKVICVSMFDEVVKHALN